MFRFPTPETSCLVLIDMQEKLLPPMHDPAQVLSRCQLLLKGMAALQVPVVVTEQYPKGLGATVPELAELLPEHTPVFAKTSFSCFGAPGFSDALNLAARPSLILAGVEAHVCCQQTALEALNRGFQVLIPFDAVGSRRSAESENALAALRAAGCGIFSAESLLFLLLRDAKHPAFRSVSLLVR